MSHRYTALLVLQGTHYAADLSSHNGSWRLDDGAYRAHDAGYVALTDRLRFDEAEVTPADLRAEHEVSV